MVTGGTHQDRKQAGAGPGPVKGAAMNTIVYAAMAYGLTALISLVMVGIIVLVNNLMKGNDEAAEEGGEA